MKSHRFLLIILVLVALWSVDMTVNANEQSEIVPMNKGLLIDDKEIAEVKRQALSGSSDAAYRLFVYYEAARVGKEQGRFWMIIAAENGHDYARYSYAERLFRGSTEDQVRARYWIGLIKQHSTEKFLLDRVELLLKSHPQTPASRE